MGTLREPSIYDVAQRTPIGVWQSVDVTFNTANVDTVVPHNLNSPNVRFYVTDSTAAGVVFRGTKAPAVNYTVLQASVVGSYHIILYVEVTQNPSAVITSP